MWKPDRRSSTPIYLQIADRLQHLIAEGEYSPGSPLPSERKLAELFDVNRSTIVQAYTELRAHGLIESRPGSKTRVSLHQGRDQGALPPEWHRYAENGVFLPNVPFLRHIREALAQNPSIIDFASGKLSLNLSPVQEINEIMRNCVYQPEPENDSLLGFPPLRRALAAFLQKYRGINVSPDSILITSGSQQALYLITQCLLSPGDAVAVEAPSYTLSLSMFQSAGLRMYRLPVDEYGVRPEGLRTLQKKYRIRMLFVNPNFQNPTGTLLHEERKKLLLETAGKLRLPIVEDDQFSLTAYGLDSPPPLKAETDAVSTLYIGSFSKIAASGLRIGWIVAPASVIRRLSDARRQMDLGFSVIPQQIAAKFMASQYFDPHMDRLRRELILKRDTTAEALRKHLGDLVEFTVPQGGLHLWCRILPEVSDSRLLDEALRQRVAFVPGSVYGSGPGYMRLTYARPNAEDIEPGISRLAAAVRTAVRAAAE
ncbi:MocR-like pyridoxine biosynthesis transcription factor PdxR [Paenibacillus physcomitrellae]|uniref:GntR family transcriptional regulator n=1 Tax=Paenibacillus physcomitrellae TaxID=1619311 RepID=A0ABQ1FW46_9BACL|nr:PLP-dependent aminotransferase family protein [Paenibacillus physcomitrellae]GGA31411.1 GntR family transcriptional regulator [Paenibacillus physcomitrellae]